MFRGGLLTIEVLSAEALPLCSDDKENGNASVSKLRAFVEVKVIIICFALFDHYSRWTMKKKQRVKYWKICQMPAGEKLDYRRVFYTHPHLVIHPTTNLT